MSLPVPLPSFPPASGLRARHPVDLRADAEAMAAVANASLAATGEPARESGPELYNELLNQAHGDPLADVALVERESRLVAYARVQWRDHASGALEVETNLVLDPGLKAPGPGPALLRWAMAHGRTYAVGQPAERPRWFAAWCGDEERWTRALLDTAGFRPVRHFQLLVRPTLGDLGPPPPLPAGLEDRPVRPEHWRAVWEADLEAFRDHWGTPDTSEAGFARFQGEASQRPDLWQVAWAGDEVAGFVLVAVQEAENAALGVKRGWLDSVAVRRPWRRRGLATALVARALVALRDAGFEGAILGVDAENPHEATALYVRAGFATSASATVYHLPFA